MTHIISREVLLKSLSIYMQDKVCNDESSQEFIDTISDLRDIILSQKDVQSSRVATWNSITYSPAGRDVYRIECSTCRSQWSAANITRFKFCPNCGAVIREC